MGPASCLIVSLLLCRRCFPLLFFYPPSLSFCHHSARLMSVMCTERSLLPIMSRHAPYCWLATSFFWYSARLSFLKRFWKNTYPTFKIFILTRKINSLVSRTFTLEQKSGFKLERNKDFTFIVIIIHMDMKKKSILPSHKVFSSFL